jgi:uncharacterized protein (DUF2147 family)
MSRSALLPALALVFLSEAVPAARPPADITGSYRMPGGAVITIGACDDGVVCGHLARLGDLAATDKNNPVKDRQNRSLCGATVLDKISSESGYWLATLYDAHNGTEYYIAVEPGKNGAITVSGHTTAPLVSRTYVRSPEIWARVPAPANPCVPALTS